MASVDTSQPHTVRKNQWQQDIGPDISLGPGPRPSRVTLSGLSVTLEPLTPDHAPGLWSQVKDVDKEYIWTYMPDVPSGDLETFTESITLKSASTDPIFFAVLDNETKSPVGWISLMRIDSNNRVVEVGHVLFSPALQRTRAATETMYLLAKYVFGTLNYRRYEWKCDNLNGPSKRAATRLGFTFEGVFRKHVMYKGRSRDTAWFSMVDDEWPTVRKGFENWLKEENFENGKQIARLEELRK